MNKRTIAIFTMALTISLNILIAQNMEQKLTDNARQTYRTLWPEGQNELAVTDPDLAEVFGNFAYEEAFNHSNMDIQTKVLMIMASTIGSNAPVQYRKMVHAALNVGVTSIQIKEILYQAVPYTGMSKVSAVIDVCNEVFTERSIALPVPSQSATTRETRYEKGINKQIEIFGKTSMENNHKNSPEDLIHLQHYLADNCFGDYVTRDGLDVQTREMATLSFLISLGGTEPQIKGHIQGNINIGNDRQRLIDLITQLLPYIGYPRTLNALTCLNEVAPAK
ncbi:MAG: carboxymuconolactone decarboxylase family protein [Tannerellaceae bacterium]|nr:carboxymuconolactone decarboxylase family protein [Tannerellaceae bacterium]